MNFKRIHYHQGLVKNLFLWPFHELISALFFHILPSSNKHSSIQAFSWVTIQRLSETIRSLIVWSVLPGKLIIGGKIYTHVAMVRTTVTCFFSQTVTSLEPLFTKDLFGTTSKKLVFYQCCPRVLEDIFLSLRIRHTVSLRTA